MAQDLTHVTLDIETFNKWRVRTVVSVVLNNFHQAPPLREGVGMEKRWIAHARARHVLNHQTQLTVLPIKGYIGSFIQAITPRRIRHVIEADVDRPRLEALKNEVGRVIAPPLRSQELFELTRGHHPNDLLNRPLRLQPSPQERRHEMLKRHFASLRLVREDWHLQRLLDKQRNVGRMLFKHAPVGIFRYRCWQRHSCSNHFVDAVLFYLQPTSVGWPNNVLNEIFFELLPHFLVSSYLP